ncbi:MAG: thiol:disulfide interchange protein DsbA/DsbL [Gammaproteobacteria bacterium]|nr:thiol:disulfide interchange protein DsbA/DsbL [Gammaproteobacteria bacterium]
MKNRSFLLVVWLLIWVVAGPAVGESGFEEEVHYFSVIPEQPGGEGSKVQVKEFFLYTCPHCYNLEPHMNNWLKTKPKTVDFERVPAMFNSPDVVMQAKTFYALRLLGVVDELHEKIFHEVHEKGAKLSDQDAMEAFLAQHGVDLEAYRKAMKSFAVQTQARRASVLADRFDVRRVPAIVVDGKYRTGGLDGQTMMELTDYLIAKVEQEKAAKKGQ